MFVARRFALALRCRRAGAVRSTISGHFVVSELFPPKANIRWRVSVQCQHCRIGVVDLGQKSNLSSSAQVLDFRLGSKADFGLSPVDVRYSQKRTS